MRPECHTADLHLNFYSWKGILFYKKGLPGVGVGEWEFRGPCARHNPSAWHSSAVNQTDEEAVMMSSPALPKSLTWQHLETLNQGKSLVVDAASPPSKPKTRIHLWNWQALPYAISVPNQHWSKPTWGSWKFIWLTRPHRSPSVEGSQGRNWGGNHRGTLITGWFPSARPACSLPPLRITCLGAAPSILG